MIARVLVVMCLVLGVSAHVARAEDKATKTAKVFFDKGEKLFALGRFDEALEQYQKAFDAKPIPAFLYNIGQCYRNLGEYEEAIHSYKQYLQRAPDAENREQVETLIDTLEAKLEKKKHDDANKPPPPTKETPITVPAKHGGITSKWWFWTGLTLVAGAGGVGIYEATRPGAPSTDLGPPLQFQK